MSYTLQKPPVDLTFSHRVTTPPARLAVLTAAARKALDGSRDGVTLPDLTTALACTEGEASDAVQFLGREVALFWAGRGWRFRLRGKDEQRLRAANDNSPTAPRVLAA